jgi:stage II sporulation protein AA (anti-sigma F factor antagonist)
VDQGGAPPVFSASAEIDGDHLHVVVAGEVDMATADTMLQTALREPAGKITLDLSAVTFFDSAAIHALLRLAEHYGARLTVLPSSQVRRVLEISGLSTQPWLTG